MPHRAFALGRNYLLSLGGEGVQSGFHFVLNLVLIRALTAYDYGVFAIIFILGGISLTYCNALVSVPATVHIPKLRSPGAADFQEVVFGSVALAISTAVATIVAAGLWLTIAPGGQALAGGAFVGLWTLRNHLRATMFARRVILTAAVSDASYAASGMALVGLLLWWQGGGPQMTALLSVLAAANAIAITLALKSLGKPVRISFGRGVRSRYRAIWSEIAWSLLGVTAWNIQGQALMFLVAAIVGPAAYAPIAAGIVLFSPLRQVVGAFINVVRPEFAAGLASGRYQRVKLTLYVSSAASVLCCLAYGTGLWLGWAFLDEHIFGDKFAQAPMPLIVALAGVSAIVSLSYHLPLSLIQAARRFKDAALATMFGGIVGLGAVLTLLLVSTVAWSLAGVAAGEAVCWVYLWVAALRVLMSAPASLFLASGFRSTTPIAAHQITPATGLNL